MMYETKRLILEPFTKDDITDDYLSWFSCPKVTKFNSHGLGSYVKKDAEKYLGDHKNDIIFGVWIKTTLYGFDTTFHIGNVSLQNINWINRSAEFAIIMGETNYWGQGYATEALRILIDHGFKKMNLHRIWTGTAATNKGMRKVAEKLGFTNEAIFREAVSLDGKYEDVYSFGILKNEWLNKEKDGK